jgi:hypothetical protein
MKKPVPLYEIMARLRRMTLVEQISKLRVMIALEKPYSVRRGELESILQAKLLRQLKRESRDAA